MTNVIGSAIMLGFGLMLAIDEIFKILRDRQVMRQLETNNKSEREAILPSINKDEEEDNFAAATTIDSRSTAM